MLSNTPNYLNAELTLLQDTVQTFAQKEIAPIAQKIDEDNAFPQTLWQKLGQMGLLGITAEKAYGGSNMSYLAHVVAMEAISAASASIGLSYAAHSNLCVNQLSLHGTPEQKKRYLPKLISGQHVGALAMSEPNAGSDIMSMQLRAQEQGDRFILNGNKMWITNGIEANTVIVYAKTDPQATSKGITAFIVEKGFKGFSPAQKLDKLGMRGSHTCELVFENVEVPAENILGKQNEGAYVLMQGLNYERVILAAGSLGILQACLELSLSYTNDRKQFGQKINQFQLIQGKLADLYTAFMTSRCYVYETAKACDQNQITNAAAASAILYASEQATQAALQTIQILGGNGYINEYPAGRLLRDAKLYEIGAGTSEIRRIIIARELIRSLT